MNDPSQPLPWPHGDADSGAAAPGVAASGFLWPSPPYAAYPQPQVQRGPEVCGSLGLNNSPSAVTSWEMNVTAQPGTAVGDLQALDKNHDLYADFDVLDQLDVQQQEVTP